MIKIGVITMALMSFLHAGWFGNLFDKTPIPPIAVPIDMSKVGSVVEMEMRSDDSEKIRVFSLCIATRVDGKYNFDSNHWIYKFIGHGSIEGTKTSVRLMIYRLEKDKEPMLFFDKTVEVGGTQEGRYKLNGQKGFYHYRYIDMMELPEGKYHIRLENLKSFPELKEIEVYFVIHGTHKI